MWSSLVALFLLLKGKQGWMYTSEHGIEKSYGVTVHRWDKSKTNMDIEATKTQVGIGISKDLGHNWSAGIGVATEYTHWDPDIMAYINKTWSF